MIVVTGRPGAGLLALVLSTALAAPPSLADQPPAEPEPPPSAAPDKRVKVAASTRYKAGTLHRFTMGGGYRDLWEAEIELPVLDLASIGGGLTPTGRFGGLQSAVLGFKGADGRAYSFRGTDKDPSAVLDPMLRETVIRGLVQDQMAAQHPGGPLVAGVLSEAAGVITIEEKLFVMPDDPALGKYREEFAGMVGSFFIYPQAANEGREGFHGATEIIDYKALYQRLEESHADKVDAEAFLRARLLDLLLGDFDRHRKQWRWAKLPGEPLWQPIPEDRDQAFVRYDGVGQRLGYIYLPILQCYGPDYPAIGGLTLHGWEQDRWLLTGLTWTDWERIARDMQRRLDDATIDRAVAALPAPWAKLDGQRLRADIRGRRDRLDEAAREFYEHLAAEVDVQGTDAAEHVRIEWTLDDQLLIEIRERAAGADGVPVVYRRRFDPRDTEEVRVYLRGGDDVVEASGAPGDITLRVIAGAGDKRIDDRRAGEMQVYAESEATRVKEGEHTIVEREDYELPPSDSGFVDVEDVPPRDWGSDFVPLPKIDVESDIGAVLGIGGIYKTYGFRKHPWSTRHRFTAAVSTGNVQPLLEYGGQFRPQNSDHLALLDLRFSGIELVNYHGLSNESPNEDEALVEGYFRVTNQQLRVAPGFEWRFLDDAVKLNLRAHAGFSRTLEGDFVGDRFVEVEAPYGSGFFGHLGAELGVVVDARRSLWDDASMALPFGDNPAAGYPTSGVLAELKGEISPPVWDVDEVYGSVSGSLALYAALFEGRLAGSLRVGGQMTFGKVPYFGAAYVGGGGTFSGGATSRGFGQQRFAGESAVYGNLDLRLYIARVTLLVPMDVGIHGFADVGRVFVEEEDSSLWHPSGGGGFWLAPLARTNTISFSLAASDEDLMFYLRAGFHY